MTLERAYRVLEQESEFLGRDWDRLMYMLRTNPLIFPRYVLDAYDRVMKDRVIVLEEEI